jgi:hypothetical protein
VCTNAASRARDGDPRFAPVALAGYAAAHTLGDLPIEQASKFTTRDVERAFSKRRQAIKEAARLHGYSTPRGMELATLRTRRPKGYAKHAT